MNELIYLDEYRKLRDEASKAQLENAEKEINEHPDSDFWAWVHAQQTTDEES